jgi:hypothetical protein
LDGLDDDTLLPSNVGALLHVKQVLLLNLAQTVEKESGSEGESMSAGESDSADDNSDVEDVDGQSDSGAESIRHAMVESSVQDKGEIGMSSSLIRYVLFK